MKNINIIIIGFCCMASLGFTSCNLMGLDLQENYDYQYSPTKLKIDMTAYQFIESRKNIDMSLLYEAINRIQYKDSFETKNRTYIILNDVAYSNFLIYQKYGSLNNMTNSDIKKLLNKCIIQGLFHSLSLTLIPIKVNTSDPAVKLSLSVEAVSSELQNKYQVLVKVWGTTGTGVRIVTSNLQPTNGIMHVTDQPF